MNKIKTIGVAAVLFSLTIPAHAVQVTVTQPGTLSQKITEAGAINDLQLAVDGPVDASDLYWVGKNMLKLTSLDLRKAVIEQYSGDQLEGRTIHQSATIPYGCFAGSSLSALQLPTQETLTIGETAFAGTPLVTLSLPATVSAIADGAFAGCNQLETITIPATTTVGDYAFANCTRLAKVNLSGTSAVAPGMFSGCTALSELSGTEKLETIGARAFSGCTALTEFTFPATLTAIGQGAFQASGIKEAVLDNCQRLNTVGAWAFAQCRNLETVTFDKGANLTVGEGAFFDDDKLTTLTLPEQLGSLRDYVLKGTVNASGHDVLPTNIDSIGDYALKDNQAINHLTLPGNITYIGTGAMEGMTGLTHISATGMTQPAQLGNEVWKGVSQKDVVLNVDRDYEDLFRDAAQWQEFNIQGVTGIENVENSATGSASTVHGKFAGMDLLLESVGSNIAAVSLYNVAGRHLLAAKADSQRAVIDTQAFDAQIFIVQVTLADGTKAVLKMARK